MTVTTTSAGRSRRARPRPGLVTRALHFVGWTLIVAGVVVLLYIVYALLFTNLETYSAQSQLREEWERTADDLEPQRVDDELTEAVGERSDEAAPADLGSALAMIQFVRPGGDDRPVRDEPVFVVEGVTREALTRGPGHYPGSALPGGDGNFAVAGHRTTYGAPFFHLDELQERDEIHVTDRGGMTHVYTVVEQRIVAPADSWVVADDPLDRAAPLLTFTTCHPRFSARERLVVFAELSS